MEQIGFPNQEEFAQLTSEDIAKLVALTEEDSIYKEAFQKSANALPLNVTKKEPRNFHEGNHIKSSKNNLPDFVECDLCKISFYGTSDTLDSHMKNVHNNMKNIDYHEEDEKSTKSLSNQSNMEHQNPIENHTSGKFSCKFCGKLYSQLSTLAKHDRFCDKINTDRSVHEKAKELLKSKYTNDIQETVNEGLKIFSLTQINDVQTEEKATDPLKDKSRLEIETHRDHKCEFCDKIFNKQHYLRRHINNFHAEKNRVHKCQVCSKNFYHPEKLVSHVKSTHQLTNTRVKCDTCGKSCSSKKVLQKHINTIHNTLRVHNICDICEKSYPSFHNLKDHVQRMHKSNGDQKYKCEFCADKTFKTKLGFKQHISIIHEGKKKKM